jgi:hypothetical protein
MLTFAKPIGGTMVAMSWSYRNLAVLLAVSAALIGVADSALASKKKTKESGEVHQPEGMVLRRKQVLDTTYADPAPMVAARPVATKPPVAEAAAPPAKAAPRINSLSDIKLHSLFE